MYVSPFSFGEDERLVIGYLLIRSFNTLVRRHHEPFPVAVSIILSCGASYCAGTLSDDIDLQAKWILCTLALGFPGRLELRKRIQAARTESVMKVEWYIALLCKDVPCQQGLFHSSSDIYQTVTDDRASA